MTEKPVKRVKEKTIERYFREQTKERGGIALKLNTKSGRGWPDRIALLPGARIGFAEMKSPTGRPTKLQTVRIQTLRRLGFRAEFVYTKEQCNEFLDSL